MTDRELVLLIRNTLGALKYPNDFVDLAIGRKTVPRYFVAIIPNDSCVVIRAYSLDDVKKYTVQCIPGVTGFRKISLNTPDMPKEYSGVHAIIAENSTGVPVIIHSVSSINFPDRIRLQRNWKRQLGIK